MMALACASAADTTRQAATLKMRKEKRGIERKG
jgi:hypothetical protein